MGWRGQNAYDQEAEEHRRVLPWRKRYNWRGVIIFAIIVAIAAVYLWTNLAHAQFAKLTDSEIVPKITLESRDAYFTGCITALAPMIVRASEAHEADEARIATPAALNRGASERCFESGNRGI